MTKKGFKRRGNGEGNYDIHNGLYRYRQRYIADDGSSKVKTITSKDKKQLRQKVQAWHLEQQSGIQNGDMTLKSFAAIWLNQKKPTVRLRTYLDYERAVNKLIIPILGNKKLKRITLMDCQQLINDYAENHAPRTANDLRRRLIILLGSAYDQGYISRNIAKLTRPIHQPYEKIIALNEEEVGRLLDVVDKGEYVFLGQGGVHQETASQVYNRHKVKVMIYLAVYSGCRLGELLGLKWDCVNYGKSGILISHSLSTTRRGAILEDVKTRSSYRFITLPIQVMRILQDWKFEQEKYAELLANLWKDNDLVLTNAWGGFISTTNFYKRYWHKIVQAARLPKGTVFHTLRKTHATLLLERGVNIKVVSSRLGHSSTSVTANVYAALLPSMESEAVKTLNAMIKNFETNCHNN